MVALQARRNRLLSALPPEELQRICHDLRSIDLVQGVVLYEWLTFTDTVLFPTSAVVSMVTLMEDGQSVESALVGDDGIAGAWVACGAERSPWRVIVQSSGQALVMDAATFTAHLETNPMLRRFTLRYVIAEHVLTSQSVGCSRFHDLPARTARRLLMAVERTNSNEVRLTQEFLAQMLGAHRPSVTVALGMLEERGLIARRHRGVIEVIDPDGLAAAACECYRKVHDYAAHIFDAEPGSSATRLDSSRD